jgi:RNA recognition motif-containing protein
VRNIPYNLTQEEFATAFTDKGVNITEFIIPPSRFEMNRNNGFGFVVVPDEEEQKKILDLRRFCVLALFV